MSGTASVPEDSAQGRKTAPGPEDTSVDEFAQRIEKFVATNSGSYSYQVLAAALRRAATNWESASSIATPKEGSSNMGSEPQPSSSLSSWEEEALSAPLPEMAGSGVRYHDATVWIFISSFAGLAISQWAGAPPWWGALIGGGLAFVVSALILSHFEPRRSEQAVIVADPRGAQGESPHRIGH